MHKEISKNNKGTEFKWAESTEDRNKLWKARHDVYYSVKALKKNIKVYTTDVCVPISNLVECIKFAENEIRNYGLKAPIIGNVGDGNFHSTIVYDPSKKEDYEIIRNFSDKLVEKALSLEGTVTGEHGIGITSGGGATGTSGAGIAGSSPITGAVSGAPETTVAVVGCARKDSSQCLGVAIAAATKGVAAARIASTLAANR